MKRFFDASRVLLAPADIVRGFTGKNAGELSLPARAVVTFTDSDLKRIMKSRKAVVNEAWKPFRSVYHIGESASVATRSPIGGPAVAALVEELAAFGVKEIMLWGYCGAIRGDMSIGDVILVKKALREEGTSYHYLQDDGEFVESNWLDEWAAVGNDYGFREGAVWSTDAIYRETEDKVSRYAEKGILGVEMEAASFYAVCRHRGVRGVVFLVVSDVFRGGAWQGGFHVKPFREGIKRLAGFVVDKVIC